MSMLKSVLSRSLRSSVTLSSSLRATPNSRLVAIRSFSDDTHDDFKPQYHAAKSSNEDDIQELIKSHVNNYKIMLYMKGTPNMPQCGFSQQVVSILHAQGVDFDSVNVLEHPEIREAVKKYSNWPTIPQLYVDGEFVGGCDILTDMHNSGELGELLAEHVKN